MNFFVTARRKWTLACFLQAALFLGCGETKELTLYLQDLDVKGPVTAPPVHITENPSENEIHIMPRFSFISAGDVTGQIPGHTMVNKNGVFQVDTVVRADSGIVFQDRGNLNVYPFRGDNLRRRFPSYSLGADCDLGLSRGIALSAGAHYSSINGRGMWAYRAGLGFRHHKNSAVAWRFEFGWQWEEFLYNATTIVTERSGSETTVSFYEDARKEMFSRPYGSLTLNSVRRDWPVNVFFQLALTNQRVDNIQPAILLEPVWVVPPFFIVPASQKIVHDMRGTFSATYLHFAPGVYVDLDESLRIITGMRISIETELEQGSRSTLLAPFVECDLRL